MLTTNWHFDDNQKVVANWVTVKDMGKINRNRDKTDDRLTTYTFSDETYIDKDRIRIQ